MSHWFVKNGDRLHFAELDEISGRINDQNLRSARSRNHIVAELHAGGTQPRYFGGKIVHNEVNAIPPSRSRAGPIGHGASGRTGRAAE